MSTDSYDRQNDFKCAAYDHYLNNLSKYDLLLYFNDMHKDQLIECLKSFYGNDGHDDCNFEE